MISLGGIILNHLNIVHISKAGFIPEITLTTILTIIATKITLAFIEEPINFLTPLLRSATFIFELRNKFSKFKEEAKGKFHAFEEKLNNLNRLGSTIKTGGNKEPSPSLKNRFVKNLMNDIKKKSLSILKFLTNNIS
jgi:hypothetical protein